jgi:uncharacterized protein (DUF1697 family)
VPRFVAFLRALNVGGRVVRMDALKRRFEEMAFSGVGTFIASGNVVFTAKSAKGLDAKIARELGKMLGYEVATFVRTLEELASIAAHEAFSKADRDGASAFLVGFLSRELDAPARARLAALESDVDLFHVKGREFWWLSKKKQSEAGITGRALEKALGQPTTLRGINTILRMAARYPP